MTVIHFCGVIPRGPDRSCARPDRALRARVDAALDGVLAGFGSLAAGADIVIAEALLGRGAALTIVLPFPAPAFCRASVAPAGGSWPARFEACLAQACAIVLQPAPVDDRDFAQASARAMALARRHAGAWQLAVPGGPMRGGATRGVAGTAADIAAWAQCGGRTVALASPWQDARPSAE